MAKQTLNNGENGLVIRGKINDNFTEVYTDKEDKVSGKGLSTEDYTTAEKNKLTGIADNANNYSHPANHPPAIITQDADNRFVTDTEKSTWNGKQDRLTIRTEAGAFTLSATDKDKYIRYTGADNRTISVPNTLAITDVVTIRQAAAGIITLAPDSDETLNGDLKTAGIHSGLQIIKIADKTYDVIGGVSF